MNRMEEYQAMMEELDQLPPGIDATLDRACNRKRKKTRQMILRPMAGLAACFAVFVLLVNFCTPVAYACSQVPGLRELAEAVTFSRSLSDPVENEYVQPMNLSQTKNGVTAEVAYLIVDQKQVNVFYRLDSKEYAQLEANPKVLDLQDNRPDSCTYFSTGFGLENGELRCLSIDFVEGDVPDCLKVVLNVYANAVTAEEAAPENAIDEIFRDDAVYEAINYLAEFEFVLEFDPKFTAAGKVFPVNQTVILDGQAITVTDIEVYPTHMRVEIAESEDNTAWLKGLEFYIETDWGMKFDPVSNGIVSTGLLDSPTMTSYRADSTYFYEAEHLKLVITGAKWLRKDMETTYLNLLTGESGALPEGTAFESAERTDNGWIVTFRADKEEDGPMYQLFGHLFYDSEGNAYEINQWIGEFGDPNEDGNGTYFFDKFPLKNYPYEEVWLSPSFSHHWTAEDVVVITVQ